MRYITIICLFALFASCSDGGEDLMNEVAGVWILEKIDVEGADCAKVFGQDIPSEYLADERGCAKPLEIQGNASRCIHFDLNADGTGTFLWSDINGGENAPITYEIVDDTFEYCFEGFTCSGGYKLIQGKLESAVDLRLDESCQAVYILRKQ